MPLILLSIIGLRGDGLGSGNRKDGNKEGNVDGEDE